MDKTPRLSHSPSTSKEIGNESGVMRNLKTVARLIALGTAGILAAGSSASGGSIKGPGFSASYRKDSVYLCDDKRQEQNKECKKGTVERLNSRCIKCDPK